MRHLHKRQQGITLIGFLLGLALAAFGVVMAIKIVPMYTDYYNISKALDNVAKEANLADKTNYEIKAALFRRLQTNYVRHITEKDISITRKNGVHLRVNYEIRKGLIANLDIVGKFDKDVLLSG